MRNKKTTLFLSTFFIFFGLVIVGCSDVDSCLDHGGCWDYQDKMCRKDETNAQELCDRAKADVGPLQDGLYHVLLRLHVLAGGLGLLVGPIAMASRKQKGLHTKSGKIYHWLVFAVCASAIPLAIMKWDRNAYLFFVAIFSYGFAFRGYRASIKRGEGWLKKHISGMLGSYIAMVTALIVVNYQNLPLLNTMPSWVTWILPTLIGIPLVAMVQQKYKKS